MTVTSHHMEKNKVIILGAGLAGLSLALGLSKLLKEKKLDWEVHIVEKQADFSRTGATFGLAQNGQKALEELSPGIVQELQEVGIFMEMTGGIMLGWWNCRDALLARVRSDTNENIVLHMGWLLQEIVEHDDCIQATFHKIDAETNDEILSLGGIILIGTDGVNSVVRKHLNLPPAKKTSVMMWRTRLQINPQDASPAAESLRHYLDIPIIPIGRLRGSLNYFAFNFHEKLPGTMALCVNYHSDDVDDIPSGTSPKKWMEEHANDDAEVEEIQKILELCDKDGLHCPIRQKVVEVPQEDGHGWGGKGRLTVLGDAAHALRPVAGQGGSMAFEDAVVFCRCIGKILHEGASALIPSEQMIEEAIKEFENTRLPRVRKLWQDQWDRAEKTYKNELSEPWTNEFSDWVYSGV